MKKKKVAICGMATNTLKQAPFTDDSFEFWGLNNAYEKMSICHRWFEMILAKII